MHININTKSYMSKAITWQQRLVLVRFSVRRGIIVWERIAMDLRCDSLRGVVVQGAFVFGRRCCSPES